MSLYKKHPKLLKTTLFITLILVIFISTVSFSHKFYSAEETNSQIGYITKEFATVQSVMKLDSKRQYAIQKVFNIMNKYNRNMPESEKLEIANEIYKMSMRYSNLNVDLICATITHESALSWRKDVVSPVGALGLMQIMPQTGENLAKEEGIEWTTPEAVLFNPVNNIRLGCRYLSNLIHMYEIDGGLAAYNGGEKRAALWLKNRTDKTDWTLLWEETRTYVPAVLKLYEKFRQQTKIL
jgi:soluble lytic murein transglycosylase